MKVTLTDIISTVVLKVVSLKYSQGFAISYTVGNYNPALSVIIFINEFLELFASLPLVTLIKLILFRTSVTQQLLGL